MPTVTASTMIADLELADKVGCHNELVEILEGGVCPMAAVSSFRREHEGMGGPAPSARWLVYFFRTAQSVRKLAIPSSTILLRSAAGQAEFQTK